jgi:hypothetical protein
MEKENNPIYDHNTLEFVTVALEFCTFAELTNTKSKVDFLDKGLKLLPLLYLKASMLPDVKDEDADVEQSVTEEIYESVRERISSLLEDKDAFLDTFHPDMSYSDTPIASSISECLADVYQDIGNFISVFRQGYEEAMSASIAICKDSFKTFWGQQLLNAMKAMHAVRYNDDDLSETEINDDDEDADFI